MREGNTNKVFAVDPGTSASKAGMKVGDVILSINGQDVNPSSLFLIRSLISKPDVPLRLGLRRGQQTFELSLE